MKQDLAREYREAMEEFCSLMTGLSLFGADETGELQQRIQQAETRCAQVRAALYDALGTPTQ
jgi:hypothetical protein